MNNRTLLLAASVSLNFLVLLILTGLWFWRAQVYHTFIHPQVTAQRMSFFAAFPVREGHTVFLGDSLTQHGDWGELFPGQAVHNRGISGDTTSDVQRRLSEVTTASPGRLFLMIGTNDLGLGVSEAVVLENVAAIVDEIRLASPQTEIFLQTLLPRSQAFSARIHSVNQGLRDIARTRNVALVVAGRAMAGSQGELRPDLTYDELHLSGRGYRVWRETLAPWVLSTGGITAEEPLS